MNLRFSDLKEGLHEPQTPITFSHKNSSNIQHEIVYVNQEKKEIVFFAFGRLQVMTKENFECRGYISPKENQERQA